MDQPTPNKPLCWVYRKANQKIPFPRLTNEPSEVTQEDEDNTMLEWISGGEVYVLMNTNTGGCLELQGVFTKYDDALSYVRRHFFEIYQPEDVAKIAHCDEALPDIKTCFIKRDLVGLLFILNVSMSLFFKITPKPLL